MMLWRPARLEDVKTLSDWIDSPEALARWGGPSLTWPVIPETLWQQIEADAFPSAALENHGTLQAFGQLAPP
ncbi:hypothetical protein M1D97_14150 [Kushneria sp. AK178]